MWLRNVSLEGLTPPWESIKKYILSKIGESDD